MLKDRTLTHFNFFAFFACFLYNGRIVRRKFMFLYTLLALCLLQFHTFLSVVFACGIYFLFRKFLKFQTNWQDFLYQRSRLQLAGMILFSDLSVFPITCWMLIHLMQMFDVTRTNVHLLVFGCCVIIPSILKIIAIENIRKKRG